MCSDAELQFLQDVLTWPGEQSPGYVNLHVNTKEKRKDGKPFVVGWPYKTLDDFVGRAGWIDSSGTFNNVWMCMSTQSAAGTNKAGKPKAIRLKDNATWVKALWVDIDIKPKPVDWDTDPKTAGKPWKHYETLAEALHALSVFVKKVGLPTPTVVNSGGGIHVYWPSEQPLTPDEWYPYADGLKALLLQEGIKCDAGLTTDVARLLRVPGTLNHKYDPPRKVELLKRTTPYRFELSLPFLKNFETQKQRPTLNSFGSPDPAFAGLNPHNDTLQAGIDLSQKLVDPRPVFKACGFLKHALKTGGADYDNPQWHLSVVCTAFMENGNDIAHQISKGHASYSKDGTQAEFDRAVADRTDRGLGYPSCSAIRSAGSTSCEKCPLFQKGKSPLNIRPVVAPVTAKVKPAANATRGTVVLPDEYEFDTKDRICLVQTKTVKGEDFTKFIPIFENVVHGALVYKNPDTIRLNISQDKGHTRWAQFAVSDLVGMGAKHTMVKQGLLPATDGDKIERFIMSFMAKMWAAQQARPVANFGWYRPYGPIEGFSFGSTLFKTNGQHEPSGVNDSEMLSRYEPKGDVSHWHNTASYIFRQCRPDFEAIIAVAFAAPLMELTGTVGAVLASMGAKGAGKSYSLEVAAAVWGHPRTTVESKKSTEKSLMDKMGSTNGLPAFWGEVSDPQVQGKFLGVVQDLDQGANPSRLNASIQQRERKIWNTAFNINGNISFRAYIVSKQKSHGAALRRVLEYWVPKDVPNPKGQVPVAESQAARGNLSHNYGGVGMEYAQYIVEHLAEVERVLQDNIDLVESSLHPDKEESYWASLVACLLTGAEIATRLPHPVGFNIPALQHFLFEVFLDNRAYASNMVTMPSQEEFAEDHLVQYLKERLNSMIWTMTAQAAIGRVHKVTYRRLQQHISLIGGVCVQWDYVTMTLRFSRHDLEKWCHAAPPGTRDYDAIEHSLKKTYQALKEKKTLGAGTDLGMGQEWVWIIDIKKHAALEEIMRQHDPEGAHTATVTEAAE